MARTRTVSEEHSSKPDHEGATWLVTVCGDDHVHVDIQSKQGVIASLVLDDTGAYDFAQALLRGYDVLNGIAEQ